MKLVKDMFLNKPSYEISKKKKGGLYLTSLKYYSILLKL